MALKRLKIYRPNKDLSKGCAFQFGRGKKKNGNFVMFIEAVLQSGNKPEPGSKESPFNWQEKLVTMLNNDEIASLALAFGNAQKVDFIHKSVSGSSQTSFVPPDGEKYKDWMISLSVRRTDQEPKKVVGFLKPSDIYQLHILIREIVRIEICDLE